MLHDIKVEMILFQTEKVGIHSEMADMNHVFLKNVLCLTNRYFGMYPLRASRVVFVTVPCINEILSNYIYLCTHLR
jgi:hypothetical protein